MVKKHRKSSKKKKHVKTKHHAKLKQSFPTLKFVEEKDIAMDFATKAYQKFNKIIKAIVLFGSTVKQTSTSGSDIDIIIIIDDASIKWDDELVSWYREELGKLMRANPYDRELHINTTKLTTWWNDLLKGDPTIINILRYGEELIDFGGFFNPLKALLEQGKIHSTSEAIYTALNRAPAHIARSRASEMNSIEGLYWSMVDSAHAVLMAAGQVPPSPEHVPIMLKELFVDKGILKMEYVVWYRDLYVFHRKIVHGDITNIEGGEIDKWRERAEEFLRIMAKLVDGIISSGKE